MAMFKMKQSDKPTGFFLMGFCLHIIGFILMSIGLFTPYWTKVTETTSENTVVTYERGLIVQCEDDGTVDGCTPLLSSSGYSSLFNASLVFAILGFIIAIFCLQFLFFGIIIRGCQRLNLSIPVAVLSIITGAFLVLSLVFFEISIVRDFNKENQLRSHTFGLSRGIIATSLVIFWIIAFFMIGEHFRREKTSFRNDNYTRRRKNSVTPASLPSYNSYPPPYNSTEKPAWGYMRPCNLPCSTCNYTLSTSQFRLPAGIFQIREPLDCQSTNIVYAVVDMKGDKVFIGHSTPSLEHTWQAHLSNIKYRNMSDSVAQHFNQNGKSFLDARVTALCSLNCDRETRYRLEKAMCYDMDRPHDSYTGSNLNFRFL